MQADHLKIRSITGPVPISPQPSSNMSVEREGLTRDAPEARAGSIQSSGTAVTATEPTAADAIAADVEKQPPKPSMPTYPEGSLKGWLTLAGAWLILL